MCKIDKFYIMQYNNKHIKIVGGKIMSKNLKRLLIATVIILVGVVLYKSGTIEVNPLNLLTWFKDVGQSLWSLIPIREIISFIVGYIVALLVVYRKRKK